MTSIDTVWKAEQIREIAKEEAEKAVASLAGLVLRRIQEVHLTRLGEHNIAEAAVHEELARIFGEALQQFTDDDAEAADAS